MSRLYSTYTRLFDIGAASHHLQKSRKKDAHFVWNRFWYNQLWIFMHWMPLWPALVCSFVALWYYVGDECKKFKPRIENNKNTHTHERKNRSFHCKTEWNAFDDRHATDTHRQTNAHIEVCTWSLIWGDKIMNANNYHFHTHLHKMKKKEREKMYV